VPLFGSVIALHMIFLLCLPMFTSYPKYLCQFPGEQGLVSCTHDDFCHKPDVLWQVDWDNEDTIDNMIHELQLDCASNLEIGLVGSLFFGSFVIGSIAIADYGDRYGRLNIFRKVFPLVLIGSYILSNA